MPSMLMNTTDSFPVTLSSPFLLQTVDERLANSFDSPNMRDRGCLSFLPKHHSCCTNTCFSPSYSSFVHAINIDETMTEKADSQTSPIAHIVSIILTSVSAILLFLVILYNVPFSASDKSNLHGRMWLVTVSPESGRSGETYGFGIWGWCSWADGVNGGDCVKKSFWRIPGDTGSDSVVQSLNLPG